MQWGGDVLVCFYRDCWLFEAVLDHRLRMEKEISDLEIRLLWLMFDTPRSIVLGQFLFI